MKFSETVPFFALNEPDFTGIYEASSFRDILIFSKKNTHIVHGKQY